MTEKKVTSRRVAFWASVSVNGFSGAANLVLLALDLRAGRSIAVSTVGAVVATVVVYGLTALDEWISAQRALLTAQLRDAEALIAVHEHMLAKLKIATSMEIGIPIDVGPRGTGPH